VSPNQTVPLFFRVSSASPTKGEGFSCFVSSSGEEVLCCKVREKLSAPRLRTCPTSGSRLSAWTSHRGMEVFAAGERYPERETSSYWEKRAKAAQAAIRPHRYQRRAFCAEKGAHRYKGGCPCSRQEAQARSFSGYLSIRCCREDEAEKKSLPFHEGILTETREIAFSIIACNRNQSWRWGSIKRKIWRSISLVIQDADSKSSPADREERQSGW